MTRPNPRARARVDIPVVPAYTPHSFPRRQTRRRSPHAIRATVVWNWVRFFAARVTMGRLSALTTGAVRNWVSFCRRLVVPLTPTSGRNWVRIFIPLAARVTVPRLSALTTGAVRNWVRFCRRLLVPLAPTSTRNWVRFFICLTPTFAAALTVTAVGDTRITPRLLAVPPAIHLQGDLVLANFEGVLDGPGRDPWRFSMPPQTPGLLAALGINALSLANNHSLDKGIDTYNRTRDLLAPRFALAGRDGREAVLTLQGRHIRIIGFSFGAANDVNNLAAIPAIIHRQPGEIVIVSAHMGAENHLSQRIPFAMEYFGTEQRGDVVAFSRRCIDAGADLVLGHGPHIPRGVELYRNKLIVYSLGNFLFDYPGATFNAHAPGYAITAHLDSNGDFVSADIASYDLQYGIPVPDPAQRAYSLIRYLTMDNLHQANLAFPGEGKIDKCKN